MPEPKLSVAEFAAKVKSKYPQYADVDDSLLVGKMVEKYPVYADQVNLDVKKKESSESTSQEEPVASATEIGSLEPQGSAQIPDFTALRQQQQVKQYGELPAQNESRLSPEAKKKVDERISAGEVQAAPAKKPEADQKPAPNVSEYLQAVEREEFNRINSVRSAINNAELELQDKTVDKSLSESFNMGWGPKPDVKTESSQAVQDARKKANDEASKYFGGPVDLFVPNEQGILVENPEKKKLVSDYLNSAGEYEQYVIAQNTIDNARIKQQEEPNAFPLTSQLINSIPESVGLGTAFLFDVFGVGDTSPYAEQVRVNRMARRVALGVEDGKGLTENIKEGNIGNAMKELMLAGADFVPQISAFMINPYLGYAYNASSAAGSTYDQFRDRNDISKSDKIALAVIAGAADLVLNKLTMGAEKSIRASLGITANEVGTEVAKKKALDYLNPIKNEVLGKGFLGESGEEGGVNLITQISANLIAGDKFDLNSLIDETLIGGIFGATTVGGAKVLARGANGLANASMISEFRKITDEIKQINNALLDENITESQAQILTDKLVELSFKQMQIASTSERLYNAMSVEDQKAMYDAHRQINEGLNTYNEADNDVVKKAAFEQVRKALINKRNLENKYAGKVKPKQDDRKEETGVPSPVAEGEAAVEAQPVEGAGKEATPADRVLQAREKLILESIGMDATLQAVERGEEVEQSDVDAAQERILQLIDDVDKSDIPADAKQAYIQTLEDKFDELEYYDNKTITTTEQVTEEVPVGAPRAGSRTVVEPEVRRGKFRLFERLNNLEVAVGTETDGQTSVIETQEDGSIDVVTYDKATKQEVGRQARVADNILGLEYVESIFDADGNVTGVVLRPQTAKGQDVSSVRIEVVNRPELAMDIAIDARKKQIGDVPEVIWLQEYETVTRDVTTKEKVPAKERPAAKEKAPAKKAVEPVEDVAVEEDTEEPTVERVKNKSNLSESEVDNAVSQAERLAKRLGLPVTIITHNTRREYNKNVSEVSKSSVDEKGVESGRFIPSRNEIHLNLEDMNAVVPFHEVFHAAFVNRFAKGSQKVRQKAAEDFYNGIVKVLRSGNEQDKLLADAVESFVKSGNYTPQETAEEFMAQTAGFMATSTQKISKSTMDKLIQWINNFIGKISPSLKIKGRGEFIDFMNSFSGALFYSQADKTNAIDKLGDMEEGTAPLTEEPVDVSPEVLNESSSRKANYRNTYIPNKYIVDPEKVFEDFRKENGRDPKVWIWMSDQLKRGEYLNPKSGVRMDLEGGIGFAFDAANQKKNIVWASGLSDKTLSERTKDADFIWFMSGSPKSSFNFSKGTTKAFFAEIESGMQNVKGQTIEGVEIKDGSFDEFVAVVNAIYDANSGKNWVNADKWTNLRKYLNDAKKGLIDKPIRKFVVENMMHEGEGKSMQIPVQKFLHETLGVPQKDVFHSLLRDEALVKNNVRNGDLTLIVKPTGIIRGSNVHDTYPTAITGEIVGMPDKLYSVLDVVPEEAKTVISRQTGLPIPNASPTTQIKNAVGDVGRIYKATELQTKQAQKVYDNILEESSSKTSDQLFDAVKAGLLIHATKSEFDTFDPQRIYAGERAVYGYGFYFTGWPPKAQDYGDKFIFTPLSEYRLIDVEQKVDLDFARNFLFSEALRGMREIESDSELSEILKKRRIEPYQNMLTISREIEKGIESNGYDTIDSARKRLDNKYRLNYREFSDAFEAIGFDGFSAPSNQSKHYQVVIFNFEKLNDNLVKDEADYLKESSSRDVRAEILDKEQESRIDRAKRTAASFIWNETQDKVRVFKERMSSQVSFEKRQINKFTEQMNNLLKKSDVETVGYVKDIMYGKLNPVSQRKLEAKQNGTKIFTLANTMRNYLDSFSNEFVDSQAFSSLPEDLVEVIVDNFGKYMRGSYRFWKDKNYNPSSKSRRDAIEYEYEILRAKKVNELIKKEGLSEGDADEFFELYHDETLAKATDAIDGYIEEIKKIRNSEGFKKLGIISPSSIKLPSDEFTRKKNLPQTIKNILGEETDPLISFIDTAVALANIKYKGQMLYSISESLGGTKFIKNEVSKAEEESKEYRQVKDKFSPLFGRYVHKDIFEAITDVNIYQSDSEAMQVYLNILQLARKSKVIYNISTWRKQLTGGWYTMLSNGVINKEALLDMKRRAELFKNGETDQETEDLRKIMADNGLFNQSVDANLIGFTNAIYARAAFGDEADYNKIIRRGKDLIKNFDATIGSKYAAVDDYTKLVVFRNEIQSFAKKLYGKSYDSLTNIQKNKVHEEAAEFVKQNTPTFSRLPKWYGSIANKPVGDFLSFEIEALRSFGYNIVNGNKDILKGITDTTLSQEQKSEYIKSGVRHLAGAASIYALRVAITTALASAFMGDDDELIDDVKNIRPNWMEGHSIIPVEITKEGIAKVYDYSMEDPYGSFFDLLTFQKSIPEYLSGLLGPNMGVSYIMSIYNNKDAYGRDIVNSYDDPLTKAYKYTGYSLKSLVVPPFVASTVRDERARMKMEEDKYSPLDAVGRFAARAAIRDYQYNIGVQFYYFTDEFRTKKEEYTDLTGASRSNRLAELDEIKKMYQSIVNIGIKKGNYEMIASANKNVKRALKPAEEAYVLYGYEIPEQE
jgi:hypothetical protein